MTTTAPLGKRTSMPSGALQIGAGGSVLTRVEAFLDVERDQLAIWLPVALGAGIAAWFVLPDQSAWAGWMMAMTGLALAAALFPAEGRARRLLFVGAIASFVGCGVIWTRASWVAAPVLTRPAIASFDATVEHVEMQTARNRVRLTLRPIGIPSLPPKVRVNVTDDGALPVLIEGDRVRLRARLVGPQAASVPGGFDFSRVAWFQGLGATGKAIGPVIRIGPAPNSGGGIRARLSAHIRAQLPGSAGGIAAAFATGDRGGISPEDEDSMRASGLTHLLSVSGLHVTAVVAATIFLSLRILALSPFMALRLPLLLISAMMGAVAGIGYTLLTGAEVPTVRSCIAAVLVLIGIALGREAFTLRLVATGAIIVLLLWPEALIGPSFQLSFAAITAIVALHETPWMRRLGMKGEHGWPVRVARGVLTLLLTGLAVEIALAPIALFHFHKSGLYGALANIIAIPLTTFIIMPVEALALLFDLVGLGAPFWWLARLSLNLLIGLSHHVAAVPGAQAALASVPLPAFALMVSGGLWLMLWHSRPRLWGLLPVVTGAAWALAEPRPDIVVTGDGKHMMVRGPAGEIVTLRPRAGDYVRSVLAERAGELGELDDLDTLAGADCTADVCRVSMARDGRAWRILATRSAYLVPAPAMRRACAAADIVVSDRRLPDWCTPRWFKADRMLLEKTGGLAIMLSGPAVQTVAQGEGAHPWVAARRP